jgi:hypothetical protein
MPNSNKSQAQNNTARSERDPVVDRLKLLLGIITPELTGVSEVLGVVEARVHDALRGVCKELDVHAEGCDDYGETCNIMIFCDLKQYSVSVRLYVKGEVSDIDILWK